jgi:hypothetical protein
MTPSQTPDTRRVAPRRSRGKELTVKRFRLLAVAVLGSVVPPAAAQPFGPSGGEFRVNTTTTGDQGGPAAGVDLLGRFIIVWSGPDGSGTGIFGRRFSHEGPAIDASEFRVNSSTGGSDIAPSVGVAPSLAFDGVVAWERTALYAQRFDASGALGSNVTVTTGGAAESSTSMDSAGNWVSVWNNGADIVGQRFNSSGGALGGVFTVSSSVGGSSQADVARAPGGQFVVVWTQTYAHVYARRYTSAGAPLDAGFQVNTETGTNGIGDPVAAANDSRFVVVWTLEVGPSQFDAPPNIRARVFGADGGALTPDFGVNSYTTGTQFTPDVGIAWNDTFVVTWVDREDRDGGGPEGGGSVWVKRYSAAPSALGSEFRANTYTTGHQSGAALAMQANGDFVLSWQSYYGFANGSEILAQRYCHALAGDANDDGALSVSDVFYLINHLFAGGPPPLNNSDANDDGALSVSDVFYLINYLFAGGPGPSCPLPII